MYLSTFGYFSFIVIIAIQLIFSSIAFQAVFGSQADNLNQSSEISNSGQEQEDDRFSIFNETDSSKANPNELKLKETARTPELAAEELNSSELSQIADYPLQELSSDDILATFNLVSDETLEKVLTNIKPENLKVIFDKIPSFYHESIFERLSPETQNYIRNNGGMQGISS
jgi:hypothetical protein